MKIRIFIILLVLVRFEVSGQIQGIVFDIESGNRLFGAHIQFNNRIYITDSLGAFYSDDHLADTIVVSYVGYQTRILTGASSNKFLSTGLYPDYLNIQDINVSAWNDFSGMKKITGNISLLNFSDTESKNNASIVGLLYNVPGVIIQSGNFNTNKIVIRGIGSRSQYATSGIKVYISEIPVTSGDGLVSIEDFDPVYFSRAEIIKGPVSSLFGAGLGGVLKLNVKQAENEGLHINSNNKIGSYGTYRNSVTLSVSKNKYSIFTGGSNITSGGYRENSSFYRRSALVSPSFRSQHLTINGLVLFSAIRSYIPSSVDKETFEQRPERAASAWLAARGYEDYSRFIAGANLVYSFNKSFYLNTTFFTNQLNDYERRPFNTLSGTTSTYGNRTFFSYENNFVKANAGWEYYYENADWSIYETLEEGKGNQLNGSIDEKSYINSFLIFHIKSFEKLDLSFAVNVNTMNYHLEDAFSSDTIDISKQINFPLTLSPRFGANYPISSTGNIYFSVSHGFTPPSFEETLNQEGLFNADIKPSTGWSYEFGIRGRSLNDLLFNEFTVYYMDIKNLLTIQRLSEEVFMTINAGKSRHWGLEGLTRLYYPLKSDKIKFSTDISYHVSVNKFLDFKNDQDDFSGNHLPGVPPYASKIVIRADYLKLSLQAGYYLTGKMYLNDENNTMQDKHSISNLNILYNLVIKKMTFELNFGVNNVFNRHYSSMLLINATSFGNSLPRYYYPGFPRNYSVGINISF